MDVSEEEMESNPCVHKNIESIDSARDGKIRQMHLIFNLGKQ